MMLNRMSLDASFDGLERRQQQPYDASTARERGGFVFLCGVSTASSIDCEPTAEGPLVMSPFLGDFEDMYDCVVDSLC